MKGLFWAANRFRAFSTIVACQSATFACVNAVVCCSTVSTDCSGHGERVTQSGGGDLSLHSQDRRSRKEGVGLREAIARWRCAPSAARGSRPRAARRAALRLTSLTTSCTSSWLNVRCTEHARQSAHTRHPAAAIRPRGAGAGTGAGASVPGRTSPSPNSSILERPPRTSAPTAQTPALQTDDGQDYSPESNKSYWSCSLKLYTGKVCSKV